MKRRILWITAAIGGALIAGAALLLWYAANTFMTCETDVRKSMPSPDGKKAVIIFGKECGATVGHNTQASIAPTDSSFSAERDPPFFITSGLHVVQAKWLSDNAVEITLIPGGEKVFKNEQRVGDVRVIYP